MKPHVLQLIEHSLERLEKVSAESGCQIEKNLMQDIIGSWDPMRLEQVVENLLSNAFKYSPGKPVSIHLARRENSVELIVRDSGPGIEKAQQARIFERFIRVDSSPQIPGLGLGLYISRQIVLAHGGYIKVRSSPGEGAEFIIELPR